MPPHPAASATLRTLTTLATSHRAQLRSTAILLTLTLAGHPASVSSAVDDIAPCRQGDATLCAVNYRFPATPSRSPDPSTRPRDMVALLQVQTRRQTIGDAGLHIDLDLLVAIATTIALDIQHAAELP